MREEDDRAAASRDVDPARLEAWLHEHVPGTVGPIMAERVKGGQSNPTYLLTTRGRRLVLRAKPSGPLLPSAHAVDREFRVLEALAGTDVPVPHVHGLCRDDTVLGAMFYVMDFVPGRVLFDPRLPGIDAAERGRVFDSMNRTIAAIHSLDPAAIGLSEYGRPEDYLSRLIDRWTKQYRASETGPNAAMEALIDWLPRNLPPERSPRLVHGDYRLDNLILHPSEPRTVAVLDWELSTLGDPLADFAYHAMTWRITPELFRGLKGTDLLAAGIPDEETYLRSYLERTGFERPDHWDFYVVLGMFRLAAILQGIAHRAREGTANDPGAAELGAKAVLVAELAWESARAASSSGAQLRG